MNLNCFSFILAICLSSIYVQPALANWPVFSIEKGGTAVVPCVPKGDETAYFWSKGEDFATSQSVASRVTGLPSSDSEKYLVNEDGSLVIYNVTLADGGIYHCRIVSENTNCRGAVSINVTVNDFSFGIEQCEPNESCSLQVEPSKETNLTCTAKGGPSSLSLKWFNGSKEITSVYSEHSLNEESITVSETITVPNEFGLLLTCKAVVSEDGQACARLAHVRLQKTETAKHQTFGDIFSAKVSLVMILNIYILAIFLYVLNRWKRKYTHRRMQREDQMELLLQDDQTRIEDTTAELERVKNDLTEKKTTLTDTTAELEKVKNDLTEKKTTLTDTTAALEKVKNDLTEKETTLTDTTAELEKVKNDLTEKKTTLTESSFQTRKSKRRSGKTSSLESERGSLPRNTEIKDAICIHNESEEKTYRRARRFQSSETITKDGGRLEITKTGVSLIVPPGALLEDCNIHIQIITGNLDTGDDVTFASNSAAIVELTPNNFEFQNAVELYLPHCLQLKENFMNESIEVFTSHHDPKDQPRWERETEVKFELQKETCKLYLRKFCWVTLRVNNNVVEAKRLKIFTVGGNVTDTDSESTVHVGYFLDVPGNEDIFINEHITIGQYKPFWFQKQEQLPLVILLNEIKPTEWTHTADGRRKEISYEDIASSKNRSCEFVLRCITSVRRSGVPYTTFRVYQQHESTSISYRPKIWDDFSEDEEP